MIRPMIAGALLGLCATQAQAEQAPQTLNGLLQEVRQFSAADKAINRQRESLFDSDLKQQHLLLEQSKRRLRAAETEQERLKNAFDTNDLRLAEMESLIQQRAGQLGEVFGVA